MDNPNFIPGNHEHNFKVLEYLSEQENPPLVLLYVTEDNIRNGQPGNIYECAISQAAKQLFGNHCTAPTTKQVKGSLCLQVSDPKKNRRYVLHLGQFNDPRGFDPEQYDIHGENIRPGAVLVQGVDSGPRPIDKYPQTKRGEWKPQDDLVPQEGVGQHVIGQAGAKAGSMRQDDPGSQDVGERGGSSVGAAQPMRRKRAPRVWVESGTSIKGQDLYLRKKVSEDTDAVDIFR